MAISLVTALGVTLQDINEDEVAAVAVVAEVVVTAGVVVGEVVVDLGITTITAITTEHSMTLNSHH